MKTQGLLFILFIIPFGCALGQSKYCDEIVTLGDTVICRDFSGKHKIPFRENFYLNGKRIFTRWWHRKKNGEFEWTQRKSKGAFAKANGPAYVFYANGKVKLKVTFEHDKIVGQCRTYYPSGVLKRICPGHVKGKLNGIAKDLHENGKLAYKTRWENGRLLEIISAQDEQGNNIPFGSFKNGNGMFIMKEKGEPDVHYTYKNGKLIKKLRM